MAVVFDTLKLSRRLQSGGFTAQQAEALAEEALADLATKEDLRRLRTQLLVGLPPLVVAMLELWGALRGYIAG
jgi:hypothetical protein